MSGGCRPGAWRVCHRDHPPDRRERSTPCRARRLAGRAGSRHGHLLLDMQGNKAEHTAETSAVCQLLEDNMTEIRVAASFAHHTTRSRRQLRRCKAPGHPDGWPDSPAPLAFPGSRPPGQLRRQQARAHRLTRRVPTSQIAHHRQRRDHTRHADALPHNHKSKNQQTTSPVNGRRSATNSDSAARSPLAKRHTPAGQFDLRVLGHDCLPC